MTGSPIPAAIATRSTIAAVLAHTTTGQPASAIAASVVVWADGTSTATAPGAPAVP